MNFFSATGSQRKQITIKITCCIQRQYYAGRGTIFSKMNFVLEELRQVDFARYNKKSKAPFLLVFLLFFSSLNSVAVVRASIFHAQRCKHQNSALALSALSLCSRFRDGL